MKIELSFWLEDERICLMDSLTDPFKVGDIVMLQITELYPSTIDNLKKIIRSTLLDNILADNSNMIKTYSYKHFKITRKNFYLKKDENYYLSSIKSLADDIPDADNYKLVV